MYLGNTVFHPLIFNTGQIDSQRNKIFLCSTISVGQTKGSLLQDLSIKQSKQHQLLTLSHTRVGL